MAIIIIAIIIAVCLYMITMYNGLVKLNNLVDEAFATMDVYLKKRWDLIPNILESVKGYAKHEKETLSDIVELRNSASSYDNMNTDEKINTNKQLDKGIQKLMVLVENYPDLKASENFKELNTQLAKVEEDIANSRKYYNGVVRKFNDKVEIFPNNIFASIFGFKSKKSFEVDEAQRENVKVSF